MERGLMFAHRSMVEHVVLQRILVTEPDVLLPRLTVEADQTHTLIAEFLTPYLIRHGMSEGPTWSWRPTSWPAWCSPTSARPAAGTSTTPTRWPSWSARNCWPASGDGPGPPPSRAAGLRAPPGPARHGDLRPLQPPDLHRVHDPGAGRLAVSRLHAGGLERSRQVPASPDQPRSHGVVGSTNPTPIVLDHRGHQRRRVLPRALRHDLSVIDRFGLRPDRVHGATSTTGPSLRCGCTPTSSTSPATWSP